MIINSYPKVYALGHKAVEHLWKAEVRIEEKIDGSQFSFGKVDGVVHMRSKGVKIYPEAADKMFKHAAEAVLAVAPKLVDGWIYRCEYLAKPKQNVLTYDRIPLNHLMVFDIETGDNEYMRWGNMAEHVEELGFEAIPLVTGWMPGRPIPSVDDMILWLDKESVLGGQKREGVVFKNHQVFGMDGKFLAAKYVSEAFKESHAREWKVAGRTAPGKEVVQLLIDSINTEARWKKAVQRLRDEGKLKDDAPDIGPLMKIVKEDGILECEYDLKEQLWKWAKPLIQRGLGRGLPEWYKLELAKRSLSE